MNACGFPLRVGTGADRDTILGLFDEAGFSERTLRQRGDLDGLELAGDATFWKTVDACEPACDRLSVLIRLFLSGHSVQESAFEEAFTSPQRAALGAVDLVRSAGADRERVVSSPIVLSPVRVWRDRPDEIFVAADRQIDCEGRPVSRVPDVVFTGHNPLTRQFLGLLPSRPMHEALDLCSGGGVAAIALARGSDRVVSADITPRSQHFGRFNSWLNQAAGITFVNGDLYAPVARQPYEFISAHPPYVPTLREIAVFRDGGTLGDAVIQRVVAGLPEYLGVDGSFFMLCMGMDTREALFEQRVRQWLGPSGASFDVVIAVDHFMSAVEFADYIVRRTTDPAQDERDRWGRLLEEHKVTTVLYGAVLAQRRADSVKGETRRVQLTASTTRMDIDRLFAWLDCTRHEDFAAGLLDTRLGLSAGGRLEVHHAVVNGAFEPMTVRVGNDGRPFPALVETEPWIVTLLSTLHGHASLRAAVAAAREAGRLPEGFADDDAVRVASFMVERGILELVSE